MSFNHHDCRTDDTSSGVVNDYTCGVAVQNSLHHLTLLGRAAPPRLAGDAVVAVTLTAL